MKTTWNYRICTRLNGSERTFFIYPVYYKGEIPNFWGEQNMYFTAEKYSDLKEDFRLRQLAFEKPVIDLDNFPEIFKTEL